MAHLQQIDQLLSGYPEHVRNTVPLHVPLRSAADLDRPGLKALLETALAAWKARNA